MQKDTEVGRMAMAVPVIICILCELKLWKWHHPSASPEALGGMLGVVVSEDCFYTLDMTWSLSPILLTKYRTNYTF